MKVSICIPTLCNTESRFSCLVECVESALRQTHQDIEVIVVDDAGDIDIKAKLTTKFNDNRLAVYRNESTISMAFNFNKAISYSKGDVIKPICDDDLLHPDLIASCLAIINKHSFLRIRDIKFQDSSEITWSSKYVPDLDHSPRWRQKYDIVDAIAPTCTMFTREVWEKIGPYNTMVNYVWDYIFAMEAQLKFGFNLSLNVGCAFRVWEESSTSSNKDPLRNYREMHVLYRRNRDLNMQTARVLYLLRRIFWAIKHPAFFRETLSLSTKYL